MNSFNTNTSKTYNKKFPTIFYHLMIANFLFFTANSLFFLFPNYLKILGATESYIGIINNIDKIFTIATALSIGFFINRINKIQWIKYSYFATIIIISCYTFMDHLIWQIPFLRLFYGIVFSMNFILASSVIFQILPESQATQGIGIYGISGAFSHTIGPLLGEYIYSATQDYTFVFFASALLMCLAFVIILTISKENDQFHLQNHSKSNKSIIYLLNYPKYAQLTLITFIFGGGFFIIYTFLKNFTQTLNIEKASLFLIAQSVMLVLLRLTFFRHIHKYNKINLLLFSCILGTISFASFFMLQDTLTLIISGILYGATHGILYPVLNSYIVEIVDQSDKSRSNAFFIAVFSIGGLILSGLMGYIIEYTQMYIIAYLCAAILYFFATMIVFQMRQKERRDVPVMNDISSDHKRLIRENINRPGENDKYTKPISPSSLSSP